MTTVLFIWDDVYEPVPRLFYRDLAHSREWSLFDVGKLRSSLYNTNTDRKRVSFLTIQQEREEKIFGPIFQLVDYVNSTAFNGHKNFSHSMFLYNDR